MHSVESRPRGATVSLEVNRPIYDASLYRQTNAPLNLARLDNSKNKRDHIYRYAATGKGVNVYILDKVFSIGSDFKILFTSGDQCLP